MMARDRLTLAPLKPSDLPWIRPHSGQLGLGPMLTLEAGQILADAGPAFAVILDGRPVAAFGLVANLGDPPIGWGAISRQAGRVFLAITKATRGFVLAQRQVETGVAWGYERGERWARALGFEPTGRPVERWEPAEPMQVWLSPARKG